MFEFTYSKMICIILGMSVITYSNTQGVTLQVANETDQAEEMNLCLNTKTHEFEFTERDIDVLQQCTKAAEIFKMVSGNYHTFVFNQANTITLEFLKKVFNDGYKCSVKNFDPGTIVKYGRKLRSPSKQHEDKYLCILGMCSLMDLSLISSVTTHNESKRDKSESGSETY
ncbi:hypothetical protein SUVZ_03G0020 [Saccharomyces uvarum]|uniref:Uncharacterized protein n=1 Tax=Saccharomyces uvarum TaxID=230603 RepID=A0ABN8WV52_SACUV|nr:hypothetical protein SUVZ_03G0020 [Saccharomyces uvarum]